MNIFISILLSLLGRALGAFVAISFGRFLESEGKSPLITGKNLVVFALLIIGLIILFRLMSFRLNRKKYGFLLSHKELLVLKEGFGGKTPCRTWSPSFSCFSFSFCGRYGLRWSFICFNKLCDLINWPQIALESSEQLLLSNQFGWLELLE